MRQLQNGLPLRGRWWGDALWCLAGFLMTLITGQHAILCFAPSLIAVALMYWAARQRGD
jgi:hypothetical protein